MDETDEGGDEFVGAFDVSGATVVSVGQTVQGVLDGACPLYLDDTPYLPYVFDLKAGETVVLTLRSEDFDAYLLVGTVDDKGLFRSTDSDDDSGGDLDAEYTLTAPEAGRYGVLANTLTGDPGRFTLSVRR